MRRMGKWLWMLTKRLYKKSTFLLILFLIPTLIFGYGLTAQEESGALTVALARQDKDPLAEKVIRELTETPSLIRFVVCDTPEQARGMIDHDKADAAWIFHENMEEKVYEFVRKPFQRNAFITVIEKEDTVPIKATREKLSGVVFKHISPVFYVSYIREKVPELDHLSDAELMTYYDGFTKDIHLFSYAYLESSVSATGATDNYLLAPVRGMLAIVMVLGGLAASMYYIKDEQTGTFSLVPKRKKAWVELSCQLIAVLNMALVAWLALNLAGLAGHWGREVLCLLLYSLCVTLFCMTVRRLCGGLAAMGAVLPLLVVVMLVICPVFLELVFLRPVQKLFPPTYYVNAIVSDRDMLYMGIYSMILLGVYVLAGKLLRRK